MKDILISISPWVDAGMIAPILLLMMGLVVIVARAASGRKVFLARWEWLFALLIFSVLFLAISVDVYRSHYALDRMIDIVSHKEAVIKVNGELISDKKKFVDDLKKIYQYKNSGTSPTVSYEISVKYGIEEHKYLFKRDSANKNIYWIYYPDFKYQGSIGYVNTHVLN